MALRVLLADESSTIKRVFEISLRDLGLEIKSVQHGIDVIEVAESFQPDIIFADVLVSKMNGYEVCAEIKQNPQLSMVPVVLMWSSFMDIDEDKYSACNADGRLEKPFSNDQLRSKIQSLVPRTLDNPVAEHVRFSPSVDEDKADSSVKRRKDPTEALLFKEDLPLEMADEDQILDPSALESSLDDQLDQDFDADLGTFDLMTDDENTDVDIDAPAFNIEAADDSSDDDDPAEDFSLDGFQALDITGSHDMESSNNWVDGLSDFQIDHTEDDRVPLDFNPADSLDDHVEVTSIPSIEEEIELLEKAKEDTVIRQQNMYLQDEEPRADSSRNNNTAASIKHRSIDEISNEITDPMMMDDLLPPVPKSAANPTTPSAKEMISKEELQALVKKEAKEMLQSVIWDVVPELAKQMIEKELKRLLAEEEPPQSQA